MAKINNYILVCGGTGCRASRSEEIIAALRRALDRTGESERTRVIRTGCFGFCEQGPIVKMIPDNTFYVSVKPEDAEEIVREHVVKGRKVERLLYTAPDTGQHVPDSKHMKFYKPQLRIALRNCGFIDPENIGEYIARDGYAALAKVLGMQPDHVLQEIIDSGLRGRGGGGFPTGLKWKITRDAKADRKYVVCNADEGDPGAFMDRSILEGDPHSILEAMAINGYCTGASHGLIYIRAEYPLAIERLRRAIEQAREYGLLGNDILGSGFSFDIELRYGAGAFVCGEETALIHSMEGRRGEPTVKPPYPSESGYKGYPTNVNNVETYANIPPIILRGAEWFSSIGTEKIDLMQIKELLQAHLSGEAEEERRAAAAAIESEKRRKAEKVSTQSSGDALIIDEKIGQLDYKLAKCCNPIHGDEIFGFITVGAGITIHRTDCPNAQRLRRNYPYRVLEARWRDEAQGAFRVSISVVASDTTGMINHIAEVINRDLKLSIRSMNLSPGGGLLSGVIHVEVPGTGMVDMLIHSILRIKGVQKAYRVNN